MALNPNALKRSSATELFNKLKAKVENKTKDYTDNNLWKVPMDQKTKEGWAIVKFLPAKYESDMPFVTTYQHAFKENGQWYIQECGSHLGKPCPACEENRKLWNSGKESDKEIVRNRKRRQYYYANIYVIKDEMNPENEGKVLVWRFGNAIFNKIKECMTSNVMMDWEGKDPFAFFDTCTFRLIIQPNSGGFPNYQNSKWEVCGDWMDGDQDKLAEILEQAHDLNHYLRDELFDYDRQSRIFARVTGAGSPELAKENTVEYGGSVRQESFETPAPVAAKKATVEPVKEDPVSTGSLDVDDDDMAYFRNLAERAV